MAIRNTMTLTDNVSIQIKRMVQNMEKLDNFAKKVDKSLSKVDKQEYDKITKGIKKSVSEMDNLTKSTERAGKAAKMTGSIFKGAFLANMATSGIAAMGSFIKDGMLTMFNQAKTEKAFQGLLKDQAAGTALFTHVKDQAASSPFAFEDMTQNTQSFLATTKNIGQIDQMNNLAQRLAAFDTTGQGLGGAGFSVKEAVTGDFQSLIERFNISRSAINNSGIRDVAASGDIQGTIDMLDELLNGMGMTTDAMSDMMKNPYDQAMLLFSNLKTFFAQGMQGMLEKLQPFIDKWNKWVTSEDGQNFINSIGNIIGQVVGLVLTLIDITTNAFAGVIESWESWKNIIEPMVFLIGALVAGLLLFKATMLAVNAIKAIGNVIDGIWATATVIMTAAQTSLNAALYACPLTWIVAAIIAVIVVIAAVVIALIYWSDALGTVTGSFNMLWAYVWNFFTWIWNAVIDVGESIADAFSWAVTQVVNAFIWLWNSFIDYVLKPITWGMATIADSIANAFIDGVNVAINMVNWLIDAINMIPGVDIGKIDTWDTKSNLAGQTDGYWDQKKVGYWTATDHDFSGNKSNDWADPNKAYSDGFYWGKNGAESIKNGIGGLIDMVTGKGSGELPGTSGSDILDTYVNGGNLDGINDEVKISDEFVKVLEDYAKAQFQQNLINITPAITIGSITNQTEQDTDKMLKDMAEQITNEMSRKASGAGVEM
ncbi:hypothetical protein [Culicoidibacter larvae]|uniref:Phage tail tape measure protein n=1 Tax=Culicoidibacter larvae TaxID=2579976 RepID=A0A5R8Q7G9_9FIRM|nr:hypothetical protein [Culicoidibacter larvae]TLG71371.1 hypothetical protein FEZ08_10780 [Culicoidibacter larvae]